MAGREVIQSLMLVPADTLLESAPPLRRLGGTIRAGVDDHKHQDDENCHDQHNEPPKQSERPPRAYCSNQACTRPMVAMVIQVVSVYVGSRAAALSPPSVTSPTRTREFLCFRLVEGEIGVMASATIGPATWNGMQRQHWDFLHGYSTHT